jgi:hypothetical protein
MGGVYPWMGPSTPPLVFLGGLKCVSPYYSWVVFLRIFLKFYQLFTGEERRIPFIFDDFHRSRVIGFDMTEIRIFTLCTDGRPFNSKKLSVPFPYPGVPAGLAAFRGLVPLWRRNLVPVTWCPGCFSKCFEILSAAYRWRKEDPFHFWFSLLPFQS